MIASFIIVVDADAGHPLDGRPPLPPPATTADELISRAKAKSPQRVAAAEHIGIKLEKTFDGRSFGLIWRPIGKSPEGWIVTLHGSGSWAYDEIVLWHPFAEKSNLGIIALQWWFGGGHRSDDYYLPTDLRREIEHLMRKTGANRNNAFLHGFSRGSANLYALIAFDSTTPAPLFRYIIANAGGMAPDFPANRDIESGRMGQKPYAYTNWWLYCGGRDPNPDRDGCPAMRRTRDWLVRFGADAQLVEDAAGDHGGFHRRGENVEKAIEWFKSKIR